VRLRLLRAPFPWFGGKSRVAHLVWQRFGAVRNYVEPFAGSLAVLLCRPDAPGIETVNDADAYLSNFWRAVSADPDEVARWADWPVSEPDLHARHRWLVESGAERLAAIKTDPEYFDAKVAGWWVWGQCLWIGSGWCASREWTGRAGGKLPLLGGESKGVNAKAVVGKLPAIAGRDGGRGAYAKSRSPAAKRPHLSSIGGNVGVCAKSLSANPRAGDPIDGHERRPHLASEGYGMGVHAARLLEQIPDLSRDSGAAECGIYASGFLPRSGGLQAYMRALSARLRSVRVCCGDFERILGPAVTTCIGTTGVFLDPPYPAADRAVCYSHDSAEVWWRAHRWAVEHGDDPELRIALCGYEHPGAIFPPGWTEIAWKASGGYGSRSERGRANARRERIWFSPACLQVGQHAIDFGPTEEAVPEGP